jgi:large subunit ribosomal protein L3
MPSVHSTAGMVGRKVGMMRLYDGAGRVRGVTVIEVASNYVTQLRTPDRDGYAAVQIGHPGNRKRLNRPERGHLRQAGLERVKLADLREFRVEDVAGYELGQELSAEQFEPGSYVDVTATSKGRGFQGGVKRHGFAGGPKTHGQSDRHRAPGSVGAGTTPGRVYKGTRMAGRMGNATTTVQNLLVVANDLERQLLFVQGSVPGPNGVLVSIAAARRPALADYAPPVLPALVIDEPAPAAVEEDEAPAEEAAVAEAVLDETTTDEAAAEEAATAEAVTDDAVTEESAEETADEQPEAVDETAASAAMDESDSAEAAVEPEETPAAEAGTDTEPEEAAAEAEAESDDEQKQ